MAMVTNNEKKLVEAKITTIYLLPKKVKIQMATITRDKK
jgi:hypothetical protein